MSWCDYVRLEYNINMVYRTPAKAWEREVACDQAVIKYSSIKHNFLTLEQKGVPAPGDPPPPVPMPLVIVHNNAAQTRNQDLLMNNLNFYLRKHFINR